MPFPDLLHPEPQRRLPADLVRQIVAFAFAVGDGAEQLQEAFTRATVAASSFDPSQFAADLFIESLVRQSFPIEIAGVAWEPCVAHLAQLVAHPPSDPKITAFRREVLRELLSRPDLRVSLERSYVQLRELSAALTRTVEGSYPEQQQHRIEVLRALLSALSTLGQGCESAESGLAKLSQYGEGLRAGSAFAQLSALLAYEESAASVQVDLRVGADGSVRGFELMKIAEAKGSAFHRGVWSRFVSRVVLFFRGYRFGELEVMARLLDEVFEPFEKELVTLFQLMLDLEVYLGALGLQDRALTRGLSVCLPEFTGAAQSADHPRELLGLWNPLLLADRGRPKPSDIRSRRLDAMVLVTGPNSGGKTRLLQSRAFAQLLGQMGLFVPAASARLAWTEGLFVSLHHEVSASQKEGRLGTELMRIRALFEEVSSGDLVIFDELCSGTNPSEAEAIIRLVLDLLSELSPQLFVTTHFLDFARALQKEEPWPSLEFLQAALDERKRPTFAFVEGVADTALAAETAARLGVTLEELARAVARRKTKGEAPEVGALGGPVWSPPSEAADAVRGAREEALRAASTSKQVARRE